MAEQNDSEKTEDPTQKKLEDAHKRGDVAKSPEVSSWFVLAGGALVCGAFAGSMAERMNASLRGVLANMHQIPVDGRGLIAVMRRLGFEMIAALALPFLVLVLAAIAGNMIQHRLVWSSESLTPKFSKISPLAGLKRLFSKQALMNFGKGVVKLALIGSVMGVLLWPIRLKLEDLIQTDVMGTLALTHALSFNIIVTVAAIMAVVAAADFFFQYRQWFERQKMSLQEVKEEFKQTDGDPTIKSRIRQLRQSKMKKRMMAAVPTASVIITNPTHYAVALKYDRGMSAPLCVAKGMDAMALKIREVAGEHSIPIVENPPLARALHATVEVDQEIPAEHYKAVAEVIGYVMKLRNGLRR